MVVDRSSGTPWLQSARLSWYRFRRGLGESNGEGGESSRPNRSLRMTRELTRERAKAGSTPGGGAPYAAGGRKLQSDEDTGQLALQSTPVHRLQRLSRR